MSLRGLDELARLLGFLELADSWTSPALSERTSLGSFAEKILCNGVAAMAVTSDSIDIGLAAFYCNDKLNRNAFLTHLAVHPSWRGHRIGFELVQYAKTLSKSAGMTSMLLEVYQTNHSARRFYKSCGFLETSESHDSHRGGGSIYMSCSLE
ncbi:MAG TPA: GNAT family N-acetyltransferase [Verrucomicrobiae bacterium]|nr:GNAT family N-acetyltransferase [Verrucomicrobiae bacterium]